MEFEFSKQAIKVISKMDKPTKQRIRVGIEELPAGDVKVLQGVHGSFRLRIGNWRILFSYINENKILIEKIAPRGDAYKGV